MTTQNLSSDSDTILELVQSYARWVEGINQTIGDWIQSGERTRLAEEALELALLADELDLSEVSSSAMKLQVEAVVGSPFAQSRAMGEFVASVRGLPLSVPGIPSVA